MLTNIAFLLLPVAALSGWCVSRASRKEKPSKNTSALPRDYIVGLNFLLNEQPDKAVDIFVKMLEVDSDTVETHLALGSLFRRRGEVERATRIHQNLIARPNLSKELRIQSLLALGQDYMAAGVFDRAERIFQEVIESGSHIATSLRYLLDIYQQEKSWQDAITTAQRYEAATGESRQSAIAHYCCELAEQARAQGNNDQANRFLRKALAADRLCARASLLLGNMEMLAGRYKAAIRHFKQVKHQDPDFITEAVGPLAECYEQIGNESDFLTYLHECLHEYPRISIVLMLADRLRQWQGDKAAADFIAEQLKHHPSVRGLNRLIQLNLNYAEPGAQDNLTVLENLTATLLEDKPVYRCGQCGFAAKRIHWFCPGCKDWSLVKPIHGLEGD